MVLNRSTKGPFTLKNRNPDKPNILLILIDDIGLEQLKCYDDINSYTTPYAYAYTPNLTNLKNNGIRFTQARTMPVCSPTRASFLTGKYPFRHGAGAAIRTSNNDVSYIEFNKSPAPSFTTLPMLFQQDGYETACIGKWHLALEPEDGGTLNDHPLNSVGFNYFEGMPGNMAFMGPPTSNEIGAGYNNYWWIENSNRLQTVGKFNTEQISDRAINWMQNIRNSGKPFFLYVPFNAAHGPVGGINWPPVGTHNFSDDPPANILLHTNTSYRAVIENLDVQIGNIINNMGALLNNTYIFLISDNGTWVAPFTPGTDEFRYPNTHPFFEENDDSTLIHTTPYSASRAKGTVFEAGIRVPMFVSGPNVVSKDYNGLTDIVDIFPTICHMAGIEPIAGDGISFSSVLHKNILSHRSFSFSERFLPNGVISPASRDELDRSYIRNDGTDLWKIVHIIDNGVPSDTFEFYHLSGPSETEDPLETIDLGTSHLEYQQTKDDLDNLIGSN